MAASSRLMGLEPSLEGEAEIDSSDFCAWNGVASGKTLRIDGHGGDHSEIVRSG